MRQFGDGSAITHGPTRLAERALGPDLARGAMLLFIALANSHYFLTGTPRRGGFPLDGSHVDTALRWLIPTFVDGRAFPMFGLLFGYGVAQIVRRQEDLGRPQVRRLLWRRAAVLIGVGLLHGTLLYVGDILAAYGVLLLVGAWIVWWRDGWLLLLAAVMTVMVGMPSDGSLATSTDVPTAAELPPDLLTILTERPPAQAFIALLGPIGFIAPFCVGLWAGRRRLLERPAEHRGLLTLCASVGVPVAILGAQPVALALSGVIDTPSAATLEILGPIHDATGVFGGVGYAASIALLATRLKSEGPIVRALAATGQRSMTCYLMQSVVWTVVFTPFLLDLAGTLSVWGVALLATGTWLTTVLIADLMRSRGVRGPFETLVRLITYRGLR